MKGDKETGRWEMGDKEMGEEDREQI